MAAGASGRATAQLADSLSPGGRRLLALAMLALHLLVGALLWHQRAAAPLARAHQPLQVHVIATPEPSKPEPSSQVRPPKLAEMQPPSTVAIPAPLIQFAEAPVAAATPAPTAGPVATVAVSAVAAPSAAVAVEASPRPARLVLPPTAVRYLTEPRLNVPLLSRRLGEQGLVQLGLVIDARGQLIEARIKHSSGFARLDQQALIDIRSARFSPYLEQGRAVEWETTALLSYELNR